MYLTFNRETKELISYSETSDKSVIYGNRFNIVDFDDYTVTIKIDHLISIDTFFDETLQLHVFIPGQHTLSDDENNFIDVLKYMTEILNKGNELIEKKLEIHNDILPASYTIYMGQLALKNESMYTNDEKEIVFHATKEHYVDIFNKTMKLFNAIDKIGGQFIQNVKAADIKDSIDNAFNNLILSLNNL